MTTGNGPSLTRNASPAPSAARPSRNSPMRSMRSGRRLGLQDHGRAIGDDLAHGLADLRGIEAHHDDGIGTHGRGILDHPVDGMAPRLFQQSRIFMDLAADDGAKPGDDIAPDTPAAHHHPE